MHINLCFKFTILSLCSHLGYVFRLFDTDKLLLYSFLGSRDADKGKIATEKRQNKEI